MRTRALTPRLTCKPHSVLPEGMGDHLSRRGVTDALVQPTRNSTETSHLPPAVAGFVPAWPCSGWGLPGRRIAADAGGLLHHRFTLTPKGAVCFCGPIRHFTAPRVLPGILLSGVRTFLDPDQQSRDRPANLGIYIIPCHRFAVNAQVYCSAGLAVQPVAARRGRDRTLHVVNGS